MADEAQQKRTDHQDRHCRALRRLHIEAVPDTGRARINTGNGDTPQVEASGSSRIVVLIGELVDVLTPRQWRDMNRSGYRETPAAVLLLESWEKRVRERTPSQSG